MSQPYVAHLVEERGDTVGLCGEEIKRPPEWSPHGKNLIELCEPCRLNFRKSLFNDSHIVRGYN